MFNRFRLSPKEAELARLFGAGSLPERGRFPQALGLDRPQGGYPGRAAVGCVAGDLGAQT